ncbi:MAG: hypothetical protein IK144_05045 [Bacteroidaceae bacterium]|nr:hypothetical protein [Bacteroidaceae bacterium]
MRRRICYRPVVSLLTSSVARLRLRLRRPALPPEASAEDLLERKNSDNFVNSS